MDYEEYVRSTDQANRLIESRKFTEAVEALSRLVLSDLSDIDKSTVCINLAVLHDRLGKTDDALAWYDRGIGYEQVYCRYDVTEKKAQYLSQVGRTRDAIPLYEALLKQPYLSEAEKVRVRKQIQFLLGKSTAEWK
ncbi:MAG TPA: tetratricopeptide repeat protein [Anaerolineales bacterium]|nr:tetratricopeptide repeat protein [Anaerolineales bacterium]